MDALDHLPNTGVQISVMVFGGLSLLILGGGLFLAGRRHHRTPPCENTASHLTDLIMSQRSRRGFGGGAIGQASEEGGEIRTARTLEPEA